MQNLTEISPLAIKDIKVVAVALIDENLCAGHMFLFIFRSGTKRLMLFRPPPHSCFFAGEPVLEEINVRENVFACTPATDAQKEKEEHTS